MNSRPIRVLPAALADKIAAGEVVQRPASVVKELLENSLDAGAKQITVVVREGGKGFIRVVDDGEGMGWEDALTAFSRHATNKISTHADLDNIVTLGFRGEALAAISAVARVEMKTRRRTDDVGSLIRIEGGDVKARERDECTHGTTVTVRNLFFNTPGRRKFLKSDQTEYRHLLDIFQRTAIAHPEIGMIFISGEDVILRCQPGTPASRVGEVFGPERSAALIPFTEKGTLGTISGFLGRPHYSRKGRSDQYLYLNRRPFVNRSLSHSVYRAYEHLIEKGSFPFFIISLTVDPHRVDVNVHPSKNEVKFEDENNAYRAVAAAVRNALSAHDLGAEMAVGDTHTASDDLKIKLRQTFSSGIPLKRTGTGKSGDGWGSTPAPGTVREGKDFRPDAEPAPADLFRPPDTSSGAAPAGGGEGQKRLWQVHQKYIITPIPEGVMIVDQHAAHERILYERALKRFDTPEGETQQLLFPHTIEMPVADISLVRELMPLLESLGFVVKIFGKTTVILEGVPSDVRPGRESTILTDVIDLYKEDSSRVKLEPREQLAKSYSCRAAVKAGDPLAEPEMAALLEHLFRTEVPFVCPHGRPVVVKLSLSELDKRFGRTS